MKETRTLELDYACPYMENGELKLRNTYVWRSSFEYNAQDLIDLDGMI